MLLEEQADRQIDRTVLASSKNTAKNFIAFTRTDTLHRDTFCLVVTCSLTVYVSMQDKTVSCCPWP